MLPVTKRLSDTRFLRVSGADAHCTFLSESVKGIQNLSSAVFLSVFVSVSSPGLSPPSYPFTPAQALLSAEAAATAAALYPPMGQVLLTPRPLLPGNPYYPASAQLYMNYGAYYPR